MLSLVQNSLALKIALPTAHHQIKIKFVLQFYRLIISETISETIKLKRFLKHRDGN
jgi:ABC-type lipoprotein export system ATPase subunit